MTGPVRCGGAVRTGTAAVARVQARRTHHLHPSNPTRPTPRRNLVAPYGGVQA
ncbi:hypothetical protein Sgleb_51370 [Streptomyces glebosus]|uniref:Uncharacterized protein n=1 Tax=Streptomyces glebosus TaxID=249580 RepID=A0A640T1R0_9ACTN|nr:hypothetical protein Sgleb_51370 [Streptomyces glebosus]GHG53486.1 hypothetical protein GCM10010513_14310 [Streptomyces glebosus]